MKINNMSLFSNDFQTPGTLIVNLPFRDRTSQSPYVVKGVYGLDADEIMAQLYGTNYPNYYAYGYRPNIYQMVLAKRDLVIRLGLNPKNTNGETYASLRDHLYKAISSSRSGLIVVVLYEDETPVATVQGHITKMEASHFEQRPEAQITIRCVNPMFKALEPVVISDPDFTLESGEGLTTDDGKLIVEDDVSTAPHGAIFVIEILDDVEGFYIHDDPGGAESPNRVKFELIPANLLIRGGVMDDKFVDGDIITINSEPGNTRVTVQFEGAGNHIPIADLVTPDSVWPILFPGVNDLYVSPDAEVTSVTHTPTFWGV